MRCVEEACDVTWRRRSSLGAQLRASVRDGVLQVEVRDDGIGGADPGGHGLVGLRDRAIALGGRLTVESPPGRGMLVTAALPLSDRDK